MGTRPCFRGSNQGRHGCQETLGTLALGKKSVGNHSRGTASPDSRRSLPRHPLPEFDSSNGSPQALRPRSIGTAAGVNSLSSRPMGSRHNCSVPFRMPRHTRGDKCASSCQLQLQMAQPAVSRSHRLPGRRRDTMVMVIIEQTCSIQERYHVTWDFLPCWRASMRKQYLHLSAYPCDKCHGPVVAGSLGVRENEISKETDIRHVGAICLSCGHRQSKGTDMDNTRNFPPARWESVETIDASHITAAFGEMLARAT